MKSCERLLAVRDDYCPLLVRAPFVGVRKRVWMKVDAGVVGPAWRRVRHQLLDDVKRQLMDETHEAS